MTVRAAVIADTHIRRGGRRTLPAAALAELERADVILHAGDVVDAALLDELGRLAPVHAVLGNNDQGLEGVLPDRWEEVIGGVRIAMVHDSGPTRGRAARLHRWFPDAQVVVYGHSHQPVAEHGVDGQLLMNPGSPTERRRAPTHTLGRLVLDEGRVVDHELVHLPGGP